MVCRKILEDEKACLKARWRDAGLKIRGLPAEKMAETAPSVFEGVIFTQFRQHHSRGAHGGAHVARSSVGVKNLLLGQRPVQPSPEQ